MAPLGTWGLHLCWGCQFLQGSMPSMGSLFQLHFIGVTVRLEQKYVHFTSTSHQFIPIPIGDTLPPRQVSGLCQTCHQEV